MDNRKIFVLVGGIVALLATLCLALVAAFYFLGGPDDADYCNVALVPELAEEIGVDLPTRLRVANLGSSLLAVSSGQQSPRLKAGSVVDPLVSGSIDSCGSKTKKLLNAKQRRSFEWLFRMKEIIPVTVAHQPSKTGNAPDPFVITFGWKKLMRDGAAVTSMLDTRRKLDRAYEIIPSEKAGFKLLTHKSGAVKRAASTWLRKNSPRYRAATGGSATQLRVNHDTIVEQMHARSEQRRLEMRESHEDRVREMQAEHDTRVQKMLAEQQRQSAERQEIAERKKRERSAERDREREEAQKNYDQRVQQMRADHDERVTQMQKDQNERREAARHSGQGLRNDDAKLRQMQEGREERVKQMRKRHDERVRKMRAAQR